MSDLPEDFPVVTEKELLETIEEVFRTGANEIDPSEIFPELKGHVPTSSVKDVPTMFPHVESTT